MPRERPNGTDTGRVGVMNFSTLVSGLTEPTLPLDSGGRDSVQSSEEGEPRTDGGGAHLTCAQPRQPKSRDAVVLENAYRRRSNSLKQGSWRAKPGAIRATTRRCRRHYEA